MITESITIRTEHGMSEFMLVAKLMAGYLAGAFAIGVITLALMWWSEGREVSLKEYLRGF